MTCLYVRIAVFVVVGAGLLNGCYSPSHSQKYFVEASSTDVALEPIYSTSLYTVYFDYALSRCVIHSAHTWGQNGGGGGGTGIGIEAFRCDPNRIRRRAQSIGLTTYPSRMVQAQTATPAPTPPARRAPAAPAVPSSRGGSSTSQPAGQGTVMPSTGGTLQ